MVFTAVGTFLLTGTFQQTKEPIVQSEREARRNLLEQVMPASMHDNDLLQDAIELPPAELLGQKNSSMAYRARQDGHPVGVVLEAIAPDGYSGDINLLIDEQRERDRTRLESLHAREHQVQALRSCCSACN